MFMDAILQQVAKELKAHPITLLCIVMLAVTVYGNTRNHASAADVSALQKELRDELEKFRTRVGTNSEKIDRIYKLQLAEALRGVHAQLCETTSGAARANLQQTIDGLQDDYQAVNKNVPYDLPPCGRLNGP